MRRRRQADDPDPRPRIAKPRHRAAPIVPLNKCPPLLRRHRAAVRAQTLAAFAGDHLFVKLQQRHCIRPFHEAFYASMLSSKGFMKSSHVYLILLIGLLGAAPATRPSTSYISDEMSIEIADKGGANFTATIAMS